ncbi:MAG: MerR family transcriptional regulator [Desulfobacterales bacterium]|jgi:DNA-binding transcriptional MerR regulator|nr:MerR family transcriptional regulator [Desulfobacterales bacterium]
MNQITKATGLPKSTILFYVGQGLLPAPRKTSRNMAYYDPGCIERIRLIQQMQSRHRLSLAEIKRFLDDPAKGSGLRAYLELDEEIFGPESQRRLFDAEAYCRETGLDVGQLHALQRARVLLPLEEGRYDAEDVEMGRMLAAAFGLGIRSEELAYYAELGEKIVDREMALRNKITGALSYSEDAATTMQMVKNARMCRAYVIDRLFRHRVAAMKNLKDENRPERRDHDAWID